MEQKCSDKRLGQLIGLYELGALDEKERRRFQDHFIACDYCYQQVYSLEPVMNAFRAHRSAAMSEDADGLERTNGVRALTSESRAEEAISPLRRVIESGDGTKLEASHFYLGLGYLKHDQPGQAQAEFDTVIGMKGQYQSDAENLNQIIAKRLH